MRVKLAASLVAFVLIVVGANLMTNAWGLVTWLGITATAGTWLAGLAFVARDSVQDYGGRVWILAAIGAGAVASALFNPRLALASGLAFLVSELADWAVYTPLRRRGYVLAALASNVVGAVVDSVLFLTLAGFGLSAVWGQIVIKVGMTAVSVVVIRALFREPVRQP